MGAVGLVAAPALGAREAGVKGFFAGLGAGILGAFTLPVYGTIVGTVQVARGALNTPEAFAERSRGKIWDEDTRAWVSYDLNKCMPCPETPISQTFAPEEMLLLGPERPEEQPAHGVDEPTKQGKSAVKAPAKRTEMKSRQVPCTINFSNMHGKAAATAVATKTLRFVQTTNNKTLTKIPGADETGLEGLNWRD